MDSGTQFQGKIFIDATIDGDLIHRAGVSTIIGRESNSLYGKTHNGIRETTNHAQFTVDVDSYVEEGNPSSGTIPTIQDEALGVPGEGDHCIQAFCFRVCMTMDDAS